VERLLKESQLAPNKFSEFVGQERLKRRLRLAIEAAQQRRESLGHILLSGPAGSGKATLATIISNLTGSNVTRLSGMTTGSVGDFAGLLTQLENGDILLIEDAHSLDKSAAEFLCQPMKDFKMDIVIDRGVKARAIQLNLPRFSLIGATNRKERIPAALLTSFQLVEELEPYTPNELARIARRMAKLLKLNIEDAVAVQIASPACTSPRDILNRAQHLRDYVQIRRLKKVTRVIAAQAFDMLDSNQSEVSTLSRSRRLGTKPRLPSDPLKRRYQVFVSSTFEDLIEERRHVMQALLETKCIPTGMELFPASSEGQWKLIQRVIDDCDYYVVIIGGRYGSEGIGGVSYTEMEYDYAVSSGKSVIGFYHDDPDSLIGSKLEKNDQHRRKLEAFTTKVRSRMCRSWRTPDGLASAIKSAVLHAIEHDRKPGWIRASDLPSSAAIANLKESLESADKN
jgi:Holliday junction DNA helicase RuvB subunit